MSLNADRCFYRLRMVKLVNFEWMGVKAHNDGSNCNLTKKLKHLYSFSPNNVLEWELCYNYLYLIWFILSWVLTKLTLPIFNKSIILSCTWYYLFSFLFKTLISFLHLKSLHDYAMPHFLESSIGNNTEEEKVGCFRGI